ncbi:MAG: nicotinamide mononucleotide transporter [Bacteroidetes bacterium B1(2017)]|nr:MAG: nicotinamide mononucleotide transporter [Bacteroidetes bacterium B1(2017)]
MEFLKIETIAINLLGYPISYVELIATVFGVVSVYFASKENILTWATGLINEIFLFILFFQIQLYADMFLQLYFFIVTLYGWYTWKEGLGGFKISQLHLKTRISIGVGLFAGSLISGLFFANIHILLPQFFKIKAAFPYTDSVVLVLSIVATFMLAKKKIETWYLWIAIDIICMVLYFKKGVFFLSLEYFVFLWLAIYGYYQWRNKLKHD